MVFVGENGLPTNQRDTVVHARQKQPFSLPNISKHTDPMSYPLIYPHGGHGWMPLETSKWQTQNITFANLQLSHKL